MTILLRNPPMLVLTMISCMLLGILLFVLLKIESLQTDPFYEI